MNAKTIIDEELGDAIALGRAVTQTRLYIVDRLIKPARGSTVIPDDRWNLRARIRNYCPRRDAVKEYIAKKEWSRNVADALADADWNGARPIIVECADGYTVELAVAEISINLL